MFKRLRISCDIRSLILNSEINFLTPLGILGQSTLAPKEFVDFPPQEFRDKAVQLPPPQEFKKKQRAPSIILPQPGVCEYLMQFYCKWLTWQWPDAIDSRSKAMREYHVFLVTERKLKPRNNIQEKQDIEEHM